MKQTYSLQEESSVDEQGQHYIPQTSSEVTIRYLCHCLQLMYSFSQWSECVQ